MKEITLTVDSLTMHWRAPRAVDLEYRGTLSETGIEAAQQPVHVEPAPALRQGVAIGDAERLIIDPATGKYPHRSGYRDELGRALRFAAEVWGASTPWSAIEETDFTKLLRVRLEQLVAKDCRAVRATEVTVSRIVTTVGWLRAKKHIPRDAAPWPKDWKREISEFWKGLTGTVREPEPFRPRYTLEESQAILRASDFDPRWELLMWLGCELRLGQVVRAQRSDLGLPLVDWSAPIQLNDSGQDPTDYGTLAVHGAGKKSGTIVDLTRGQRIRIQNALSGEGYLAPKEAEHTANAIDYQLFPSGYTKGRVGFMKGKGTTVTLGNCVDWTRHADSSWIRKSFRTAEERAGIAHINGRCAYGVRRQGRDVADEVKLSRSATENFGGWTPGSSIPDAIYRNRENKVGRREARGARAMLRGEP